MADTKNVTLKNVSQRTFVIGEDKKVEPGQAITLDPSTAARLLSLYPGELSDLVAEAQRSAAAAQAVEPAAVADAIEAMTVVDLRKALKEKGIAFKPAASKAELVALMKGEVAEPAAGTVVVESIALTPDTALEVDVVYKDDQGALFVGAMNGEVVGLLPVDQLTPEEKAKLVAVGKLAA